MLLYGERIGAGRALDRAAPATARRRTTSRRGSRRAVFGYVRGQLLFSLIMGTSAGVVLWVLGSLGIFPDGKTYALAFGAFYGFAELIPYVGPAVGAFPPVLIALFSGEPLDALWLIDHVHRRCSRSRATSSRRTCSRRRCGSTRCW